VILAEAGQCGDPLEPQWFVRMSGDEQGGLDGATAISQSDPPQPRRNDSGSQTAELARQ
jgi:hypothetical protein